ncbi:MAG: hypothetical protein AAGA85_23195 [Bacteroidota bacterium]
MRTNLTKTLGPFRRVSQLLGYSKALCLTLSFAMTGTCVEAQQWTGPSAGSITTNYRVGIGGTSTSHELFAVGSGSNWTGMFTSTGDTDVRLAYNGYGIFVRSGDTSSKYLMKLLSGSTNTTRFFVGTSGRVGIGTESPAAKFSVMTDNAEPSYGHFGASGSGFAGVYFDASDGDLQGGDYGSLLQMDDLSIELSNGSAQPIRFRTQLQTRLMIAGDGKVGIGTEAPAGKLSVVSDNAEPSYGHFGATGSGFAGVYFDAADGDLQGGDYGSLVQLDDLSIELSNGGAQPIRFRTQLQTRMTIAGDGKIGIGTSAPSELLTVDGSIASEEVKVHDVIGADFVFADDYELRSLEETEAFIQQNKHLPEIASAAEMAEEGVKLKEFNMQLLQKIEELTLYVIEQQKEIDELKDALIRK